MHYTEAECREMLPKWRANVNTQAGLLQAAIDTEDWDTLASVAIELRWAGTNLKLIARDLQEARCAA